MLTSIRAKIEYIDSKTGQTWTRGIEEWLGHSEYGDYLYRNADIIKEATIVSIGKVVYSC